MDLDQILPKIYVGSCPRTPADVHRLKTDFDITAVLNVQTEEDFTYWDIQWDKLAAAYQDAGIECRRVPVLDFNPEDLRRRLPDCVDALDDLLRAGHTVYVHCSAGMNRSPSTVVAHLHWLQDKSLDEAVTLVTSRRACDPYVDAIRQATEDRGAENR